MTYANATIDIVARAAPDSVAVALEIDALVELQGRIAKLDAIAREMRARIREGLVRFDLDSITSPTGHKATLSQTTRTEIDRHRAAEVLSPALFSELTRTTVSSVLRIR